MRLHGRRVQHERAAVRRGEALDLGGVHHQLAGPGRTLQVEHSPALGAERHLRPSRHQVAVEMRNGLPERGGVDAQRASHPLQLQGEVAQERAEGARLGVAEVGPATCRRATTIIQPATPQGGSMWRTSKRSSCQSGGTLSGAVTERQRAQEGSW